jgi:predicted RND superfamily exporter protein
MARRPGRIALISALLCALLATGFARFSVDAGPDLLVGQSSQANQVYQQFAKDFGADPIVIVMAAQNPTALYLERNLLRLGALESDITRDPRVATVLGPGTIVGSAQHAAAGEVTRVRDEYPYFVAETALASAVQNGERDPGKLSSIESNAFQAAQVALAADVVKATQDADTARATFAQHIDQHQNDPVLRGAEQAAEAAASQTQPPPLFAQYLAGPTGKADTAAAQQLFNRLTAGFGDCSDEIAGVLHITATCQVFLERLLLDLPNCPPASSKQFCTPKSQWSAVLPAPKKNGPSYAVITVRLKPEVVGHTDQVNGLVSMIRNELQKGRPNDSSAVVKGLGGFTPTECGSPAAAANGQPSACVQRYHDTPLAYTIAGAPLLVQGVSTTMTHLLLALLPVAFVVMLLLLLGSFRARGRMWPLVGAAGATLVTVGGSLLIGVPVSPAVLAGVPVLVGLGVDYAVQLLARFSEERDRGLGLEAALRMTLANTGPATLVAGTATLAGVAALAVITGIDLGPLAAVPLVAEFALILCAGVVLSWLLAVFLALPAAAWTERRRERAGKVAVGGATASSEAQPVPAVRTAALATKWRAVLIPAVVLGLLGWTLTPRVPIETGVEQLLAPSLTELTDINQVRTALGYDNEIDFAVTGDLVGQNPATTAPDSVVWMAVAGHDAACAHPADVALAVTLGDVFAARTDTAKATPCTPTTPRAPGATPSPSPGASPSPPAAPSASPSPSGSPTARRPAPSVSPGARVDGDVVLAGRTVPVAAATGDPSAGATPAPSVSAPAATAAPSPAPGGTPAPTPTVTSPSASGTLQTQFLCSLRLLPPLARNLIAPVPQDTQPCPVRDLYRNVFLGTDKSPISPNLARMALGVKLTSVAQSAKLIDQLIGEMNSSSGKPKNVTVQATGLTALASQAYNNLSSRILLFNLVPLAAVALVLLAIYRNARRALLPVVPAALAAGWSSLVILAFGRLPGSVGTALGTLNPLTVVLGALVIALGTEFGVVLLQRFYEERARGLEPDDAAGAALRGVGRAIVVSALTLAAGFAVLALSGPLPGGMPLIADFGFAVLVDLALAVGAVFLVMLPMAVALERAAPMPIPVPVRRGFERRAPEPRPEPVEGVVSRRAAKRARDVEQAEERRRRPAVEAPSFEVEEEVVELPAPEEAAAAPPAASGIAAPIGKPVGTPAPPELPSLPETAQDASLHEAAQPPRRLPGMSGRRRPPEPPAAVAPAEAARPRLPGISGRRRAAAPDATAPEPTPPEPARPRRVPGGVVGRRTAALPEVAPSPPELRAAQPPELPPAQPPPTLPRSRRRRPPPWVRHNTPPPGDEKP